MKVNPNRDLHTLTPIARAPQRAAPHAAVAESDLQASGKLALKLAATPTVRADAVARAKALAADPNYPSPRLVAKIAHHLANKL